MKRKLPTKSSGAGHRAAGLGRGVETDVVGQGLREGGPVARPSSAACESPTNDLSVAACTRWIAWWLNLRLD
jgi:hypothetical protein